MALAKQAITPVSKPLQDSGTGSVKDLLANRSISSGGQTGNSNEAQIIGDDKNPFAELSKFIKSSSQTAKNAVNQSSVPFGSKGTNFGQMMNQAYAGLNNSALQDFNRSLNEAFGGRGQGGPHNPGTYGGDPNTAPGLNGYHFGSLKPIQHTRPNDAAVDSTLWNLVNNHLGRAFANGTELNDAIKPYIAMDIGKGFKSDAFALSVFAMYKPSEETIQSGKLDYLLNDKRGYSDYNSRFWSLVDEEGIDRSVARDRLKTFGGIVSLSNLDPRFVTQAVKDVDFLENLQNESEKLRTKGGGVDPNFTVVLHVVNDPGLDFNGVHNKNHGSRAGQASKLKDSVPQSGHDSTSNVIVGVVQGNGAQTRAENYTNFIGKQMHEAKANYNLVLNYDSHGSGYHAAIGRGADGSIDKGDAEYFRKIGYENALAESITVNFNSCSNGNLSKVAVGYIAQGVRARRAELGYSEPIKDMKLIGRSTEREGWLAMDSLTNYLTYWNQNKKLETIHGSLGNDMETHVVDVKGNGVTEEEAKQEKLTQNDQKQQAQRLDSEKQLAGDGKTTEDPEKKKKPEENPTELETQVA